MVPGVRVIDWDSITLPVRVFTLEGKAFSTGSVSRSGLQISRMVRVAAFTISPSRKKRYDINRGTRRAICHSFFMEKPRNAQEKR